MLYKLMYWAPKLHGSLATWLFCLPSLRKARVALMRIYGELERIARLPKRPGSLINSDPPCDGAYAYNFRPFLGIVGVRA